MQVSIVTDINASNSNNQLVVVVLGVLLNRKTMFCPFLFHLMLSQEQTLLSFGGLDFDVENEAGVKYIVILLRMSNIFWVFDLCVHASSQNHIIFILQSGKELEVVRYLLEVIKTQLLSLVAIQISHQHDLIL